MVVSSISTDNGLYTFTPSSGSIDNATKIILNVNFKPLKRNVTVTGHLSINFNAAGSPTTVTCTGKGGK
jgi:hypothetical protein